MAIRNDVTVDFSLSPRIITVAAPSTEITIQDLHDTLRSIEVIPDSMDDRILIKTSGKQSLGGGVLVGLTAELQNAKLAFEARGGPSYTQCTINGGNLVAIDGNGDSISPIEPTAFTQIVLTQSSSATLQEQTSIQYSAFDGGVWLDVDGGIPGTTFPIGTPLSPVNNLTDAKTIAVSRGFIKIYLLSDFTFLSTHNISGYWIIGQAPNKTLVTVDAGCNTNETIFQLVGINGTLSGGDIDILGCHIGNLAGVEGLIADCLLEGTITLTGSNVTSIIRCLDHTPNGTDPIVNMGGSGRALEIRNYHGGIEITNKTGSEPVSTNLVAGKLKLSSSVTGGTITLRGVGELENLGSATIDGGFVSASDITKIKTNASLIPGLI